MPQKPPGKGGWDTTTTTDRAHETRERILEAFSKHSARDALSVHYDPNYDPIW
jgi:hypothetical protein